MRVLLAHNYYQNRGGEDESFDAEAALLGSHGHDVVRYVRHNDEIGDGGGWQTAMRSVWNPTTSREVRGLIRRHRPDVFHATNTFPLLSASAIHAARAEGVPVVVSLRNYRLLCPSADFNRGGRVCEKCINKRVPWPAVAHRCYRDSATASVVVTIGNTVQRTLGTWHRLVDLFFTPTEFTRQKYIEGGFDPRRIAVKPNFLNEDPGEGGGRGGYAVFVGRLSQEKGITTLLEALGHVTQGIDLRIIGDGPLRDRVAEAAAQNPRVQYLGRLSHAEVLDVIGDATCLVMPSVWYETFGRTIIEAYAKAVPVVASRLGALAEIVTDGETGLLVEPGDAAALARAINEMAQGRAVAMRAAARQAFLDHYTGERNLAMILALYRRAQGRAAHHAASPATAHQPGVLDRSVVPPPPYTEP